MAFVGDDEVEGFDGNFFAVFHLARTVVGLGEFEAGYLVNVLVQFFAAQD